MFLDLFEAFNKNAAERLRPSVVTVPGQPKSRVTLAYPDGLTIETADVPIPPLDAVTSDLHTLVELVREHGPKDEAPEVWYSEKAVVGFFNRDTWHDQVTMPLHFTSRWQLVGSIGSNGYDQTQFIRLFRVGIGDAYYGDLVDRLRRIKFRTEQNTQSVAGKQTVSIGKSLNAELETETVLPDEIDLSVPVFVEFPAYRANLKFALETDLHGQKFQLIPLPGELDAGLAAALHYVLQQIEAARGDEQENAFAIYQGTARP